ncbi:MAG: efflux RND transporter periplasmic adaptor subunit [Anaerolineae bacterium]|nr:MAG: efflux RND transporter periplasmic adaptor subunit [Anaerolineae bacterium]
MRKHRVWLILIAALLLAAGGGYVAYDHFFASRAEAVEAPQIQTTTVRRGDLVITADGSGELIPSQEVELGFSASGTLVEMLVEVGDRVQAGDVLARLDAAPLERAVIQAQASLIKAQSNLEKAQNPYSELDLAQARLAVAQAGLDLAEAQENLGEVQNPYTDLDLTQARLAVAQAEADLADAQEALEALLNPDVEAARAAVRDAEVALESARNQLTVVENDADNAARLRTLEAERNWYRNNYWEAEQKFQQGKISQQKLDQEYSNMLAAEERYTSALAQAESSLVSAQNKVVQAEEALQDAQENLNMLLSGPNSVDLSQAENRVAQAEYNLAQAQEALSEIEAGSDPSEVSRAEAQVAQAEYNLAKAQETLAEIEAGADPDEIEVAQADLISAQASLEEAQAELEAVILVAPFTGTVTSVGASAGNTVSSNTVVVALANLEEPRVLFWVEETDLTSVAPGNAVNVVFEALPDYTFPGEILSIDPALVREGNVSAIQARASIDLTAHPVRLLSGMNAEVEVVAAEARDALLVPVQALREIGPDLYAVFVVLPDGELELRPVEVGLQDFVNAAILSGLEAGEVVSTGMAESSDSSTESPSGDEGPMPGMMRFFGGG